MDAVHETMSLLKLEKNKVNNLAKGRCSSLTIEVINLQKDDCFTTVF